MKSTTGYVMQMDKVMATRATVITMELEGKLRMMSGSTVVP